MKWLREQVLYSLCIKVSLSYQKLPPSISVRETLPPSGQTRLVSWSDVHGTYQSHVTLFTIHLMLS